MTVSASRKALLGKVHIGKKVLRLDDPTWVDLVQRVTGAGSCAHASDGGLVALATELERLGFKPAPPKNQKSGKPDFKKSDKPQVRLVFALWGELSRRGALTSPTKESLRAFCANMADTGAASTDPEFLDGRQLRKVIEALKAMVARDDAKGRA